MINMGKQRVNVGKLKSKLPAEIKSAFKSKPYDIHRIEDFLRKRNGTKIGVGYAGYDVYTIYSGKSDKPQKFLRGTGLIRLTLQKSTRGKRKR